MATRPYRAEMGAPPMPDEGPTEVKTKRVVQKKDTAKSTPKTESRTTGNVFRAEMLERFGGKMKEPPRDPEGAPMRKGGYVKKADGCAQRGKTRGSMV
jgi:hypothetical protein